MFERKKAKTIMGVLTQSYLDNMEMMGKIYLRAKTTIDHWKVKNLARHGKNSSGNIKENVLKMR